MSKVERTKMVGDRQNDIRMKVSALNVHVDISAV